MLGRQRCVRRPLFLLNRNPREGFTCRICTGKRDQCHCTDGRGHFKIRQGRIEDDTTLNIGLIRGGSMTNIVSENCVCEGEIRGYHHERVMELLGKINNVFQNVIENAQGQDKDTELFFSHEVNIKAYAVAENSTVVQKVLQCM